MLFIVSVIFTAMAAFLCLPVSVSLVALFFLLKKVFLGSIFLTYGLPTIFSVATFSVVQKDEFTSTKFLRFILQLVVPALCMFLFITHPVAGIAYVYSFYWLIPICLYFVGNRSAISAAFSATFVAHAVGSILWLYSVRMTPAQWLALIPVVFVERLIMVFGIVFFYKAIQCLLSLVYRKIENI